MPIAAASDWLFPDEKLTPQPRPETKGAALELTVPAGASAHHRTARKIAWQALILRDRAAGLYAVHDDRDAGYPQ